LLRLALQLRPRFRETAMKTTYGILVGIIGAGAWFWMRRRSAERMAGESGRVIFRNTPEPTPLSSEGVI
jgi:hypothetical protein